MAPRADPVCLNCGARTFHEAAGCSQCDASWETWELQHPPIAIGPGLGQTTEWVDRLPHPAAIYLQAGVDGLRIRLRCAPGQFAPAARAWGGLMRQQSSWSKVEPAHEACGDFYILGGTALLPVLNTSEDDGLLSFGAALQSLSEAQSRPVRLYIWIFGHEDELQDRLRRLFAYSIGTEKGVEDDTPNPWSLRLGLWRFLMAFGSAAAAAGGAALVPGWIAPQVGALWVASGCALAAAGFYGTLNWMKLRSIPKQVFEPRLEGSLLRAAICLEAENPGALRPVVGAQRWQKVPGMWPDVTRYRLPLLGTEVARLIHPLRSAEGMGILAPDTLQPVPRPPPTRSLVNAPVPIGNAVSDGERVGIEAVGHSLIVGGSRTGKSSAVFRVLQNLVSTPEDSPGLFLVDPHGSLADGILTEITQLPGEARAAAIRRLRIITPGEEFIIPLNLLMVPDFSWAGNALVQAGERIWGDFWGPRMQAALLALARLGHAWNRAHPDRAMGLMHTVFAAYDPEWRAEAVEVLDPANRLGAAALDALLGHQGGRTGPRNRQWVTEVVSPILSKLMSLELSPWLFSALHQDRFADMERWVRAGAWIVLRLPAGEIGREGARLTAGFVYNIFEAAYRRVTAAGPVPFTFVIDETQEIAHAMRLETLLSEGGKFGARMFVLAQSLSMLRQVQGFEPVVQSLLANTSSQLFFSPDPEDAELIRATLSSFERYGPTTIDVPSLQAWLRARIDGRWQPPALTEIEPLGETDPEAVRRLIRAVAEAHPGDYVEPGAAGRAASMAAFRDAGTLNDRGGKDEGRVSEDPQQLGW